MRLPHSSADSKLGEYAFYCRESIRQQSSRAERMLAEQTKTIERRSGWVKPGHDAAFPREGLAGASRALDPTFGSAVRIFLAFVAVLVLASAAIAAPKFPPLTGRVVDDAHLLTPADKAAIEGELKALEEKSSDQLVVYTTNSLQGYPIEDYGYQLGRAWGIGQKGTNNGVILIVAPSEHKVRIEVGRGLEPQLTDLLTTLIIQNGILPAFRRGDFSGGIKAGVTDIKNAMLGDAEAVKDRLARRPPIAHKNEWEGQILPLLFIVGIFFFVMWAQSRQARQPASYGRYGRPGYSPPIFFPGGWGGGGGGGGDGGGFSGGGGDFGGGGSSGSW